MAGGKVSIIVPCYNLEKDIIRCLESLSAQTYQNLEIIVVDDGSGDSSFEQILIAAKKDDRIMAVSQKNSGPSAARNHGIDLATGDYIMFVDGDDYVSNTYVEHFIEAADGRDIVIGALCYVYADGSTACEPEASFCCNKTEYIEKYYTQSVAKRTIFGPVNKLYRTDLIKNNGIRFREELSIREDGIFVLDVLEHVQKLAGIKYAEYFYVQSAPGTSLVSKFHEDEKEINAQFFHRLVDVIGAENLRDEDIFVLYPIVLNMDFAAIRKLYHSKAYNCRKGLRYIRSILEDETFLKARAELARVDKNCARKFYRPLLFIHLINYLAVRLKR